ncbi:hypothetical protein LCGC14_3041190 [marine sediment metagenome]|uniref:Nucleotide modification associated domain-containing protein n=1 Tax=marine sediment metagenome TaxID=412755 RepID=A0A0F8YXI0_9ZZZZ
MMNYDERRAEIRKDREYYGSQWKRHLDRYGLPAYFYELAGIVGRLESLIIDADPTMVPSQDIEDKLIDLGNYASFMYDWMQERKAKIEHEVFKDKLP